MLQAVPALIGVFAGAPVLAREFETGTFRYVWTQGFGRWRGVAAKLVPLAVAVAAAAGAFSVLFSWYFGPFLAEGQQTSFAPTVFDLRGVAFAAWTLAAFAIGALAGVLIRRVVPALVAALAVYAGLALTASVYLREHYLAPLVTNIPNLPGSAWMVGHWYTGKNGKPVSQSTINQVLQQYQPKAIKVGPHSSETFVDPVGFLAQHGYKNWMSYQPGSRFWPFQFIEGGWLLVISVLLVAMTVWLVHRRAA
jgi:ABC-type transport system involved in multi-copper enzyme maturation permease subunit